MKCGECLMNHVKFVDLVDGVCPECGADYRDEPILTVEKVDETIGGRDTHKAFRNIEEGKENRK